MLNYTFDWSVLWRQPYGAMLVSGVITTIKLSLAAWAIAVVLGLWIGILRVQHRHWLRAAGIAYVAIFRNTPLLVHLFFWYFGASLLLPRPVQQ